MPCPMLIIPMAFMKPLTNLTPNMVSIIASARGNMKKENTLANKAFFLSRELAPIFLRIVKWDTESMESDSILSPMIAAPDITNTIPRYKTTNTIITVMLMLLVLISFLVV